MVHGVTYSDIADTQLPKCQWTSVLFPLFARYFSALKTVSKSLQRVAHTTYCHIPKITMLLTEVICIYIYIYRYRFLYIQLQVNLRDNKKWHYNAVQIHDTKRRCISGLFHCDRLLIGRFKISYEPFSIENDDVTYWQWHSTDEILI